MKRKRALNSSLTAIQGSCVDGAEGESRTRTTVGHYPLKIACLPVPPLRHNMWLFTPASLCFSPQQRVQHFLSAEQVLWRCLISPNLWTYEQRYRQEILKLP